MNLLLEIFGEEIPARMQAKAAADLKRLVTDGLVEAGLTYAAAAAFHTPRRLALSVEDLTAESRAVREERKGPRTDAPEKALEGFLRSTGLTRDQLEARDDKKGQVWFAVIEKPGRPAAEIVAEVVTNTIRNFPWPKSMRWGAGSLRWVRPIGSILCILSDVEGAEIVPFDIDGIAAGNTTEGHRFMAPKRFAVSGFEDYAAKLLRANVMLDADARAEKIWHDARELAFARGLELVEDKALLAEVAGLVEWPVVLMGEIGADFLGLPPEVLQTSMREHQKFFSVRNPKTGRIEGYVTVANRETADNGATILAGNSKVLAARLSDAKFFWENDLRTPLADMADKLENVTFHNKLGTQAERVARIAALAREIAPMVGADAALAEQAARICKADLSSAMVGEFPELQGLMGRYYATEAGLDPQVAAACQDHYAPLGPTDTVPSAPVSVAVALADKLDTLTGFWAIDEKPTGSKDPYALRRAALGVIRLVLGNGITLDLSKLARSAIAITLTNRLQVALKSELSKATAASKKISIYQNEIIELAESFNVLSPEFEMALSEMVDRLINESFGQTGSTDEFSAIDAVRNVRANWLEAEPSFLAFFHDRLKVYLRDQGISHDVIDACLAMPGNDDLTLLVKRAEALQAFVKTDDGTNLHQGFKRANNILSAEEKKDGVEYSLDPEAKLAEAGAEAELFAALDAADQALAPALKAEDFAAAMAALAALRAPIDAFFEGVQVNADNAMIRRNRLCLLHRIRATMQQVAMFGALQG
ncbi:glycine--tRNA ligase subunit beta [Abyssibius alkaniclasticus]|uniref:glycine--tRNA ligase subunit beta n=1 Tax=Abyssibius alkaniclasticus TaxID=2881234 RepID=UPI0023641F6D|nr:glycine--tRNA ligase subunit beta [Abyssibius alkaniclasticus]UPH71115.1 glycine--tRNA ligase subunit beta [Abyssibius alkaniclasticus]